MSNVPTTWARFKAAEPPCMIWACVSAEMLGFPVAMKVRSSSIIHRTEVGGVALGLGYSEQVASAYDGMVRRLR